MTVISRPLLVATVIGVSSAVGLAVIVYLVVPNRPPVASWVTPPARMVPRPPDVRTVTWFKAHVPELQASSPRAKTTPAKHAPMLNATTLSMLNGIGASMLF